MRINKGALEDDHILIPGPTFPHEMIGFSGGAKFLFPGISGPDMINATHWLRALAGLVGTIGIKKAPVRAMLHAAASRLKIPLTLISLTVEGHGLTGLFTGDNRLAWSEAADLSTQRHIRLVALQLQTIGRALATLHSGLETLQANLFLFRAVILGIDMWLKREFMNTSQGLRFPKIRPVIVVLILLVVTLLAVLIHSAWSLLSALRSPTPIQADSLKMVDAFYVGPSAVSEASQCI